MDETVKMPRRRRRKRRSRWGVWLAVLVLLLTAGTLVLLLTKNGRKLPPALPETAPAETALAQTTAPEVRSFDFSSLEGWEFTFSSGAGAWRTVMTVNPDGSFQGSWTDVNNVSGQGYDFEKHWCDFTGQFTQPEFVEAGQWSLQIQNLQYAEAVGREELRWDGGKYVAGTAYGLTDTEKFYLYLPGKPLSELPESFLSWAGLMGSAPEDRLLPFYGLYNVDQEFGFFSQNVADIPYYQELQRLEKEYEALNERLMTETLSQGDMNVLAGEMYDLWDGVLNEIWKDLQDTLPAQEMEELTLREREWIAAKEAQIQEIVEENGGGSLALLLTGTQAAQLTRDRVYELVEYLRAA